MSKVFTKFHVNSMIEAQLKKTWKTETVQRVISPSKMKVML